jgi:hypothetical protein
MNNAALLRRYRLVLGAFIVGLVLSGMTAFPLLHELRLLMDLFGIPLDEEPMSLSGVRQWICTVHNGLRETHHFHPWLAYGTDWLAFGHLIIALFFIGPWREPVANAWVLKIGVVACVAVIPLALICGPIRGIPFYWRLIDCSFGVIGALPLLYCLKLTRQLRDANRGQRP